MLALVYDRNDRKDSWKQMNMRQIVAEKLESSSKLRISYIHDAQNFFKAS